MPSFVSSSVELRRLVRACEASSVGEFGEPVRVPPDAPAQARVLGALLQCRRWMAGLEADPGTPDPGLFAAPRGAELLLHLAEVSALRFDGSTLERLRLASDVVVEDARDGVWLGLARCFLALAEGELVDPAVLVELERAGREHNDAGVVLRAATLRAWVADASKDPAEAVDHARRAFRMARTERSPQAEYWAGWTLARLRRSTGRPYLASRILGALRDISPPAWTPWIDLQRTLAAPDSAALEATNPLGLALGRLRVGDRSGAAAVVEAFLPTLDAFVPLRADVIDLLACLGLREASPGSGVADWTTGTPPFGAPPRGFGASASEPLAVVVCARGRRGRRVLWLGEGQLDEDVVRALWVDKPGRTESLLAALALAGPAGIDEEALFCAVYGFTYNAALHRGAWDVALHRARGAASSVGTLSRREGHVALHVERAFVVPDPRCQRGHEDRILQRMASGGGTSARELARGLGLSLRTVQDVLRDLVDAGACLQRRDGRHRLYSVEDTTFQEPTRSGIERPSES